MQQHQSPAQQNSAAHTFLFVPSDRPNRFNEAAAFGVGNIMLFARDEVVRADATPEPLTQLRLIEEAA
ncbi:MAG: hypothetical protein Q8L23_06985 [Caulobacter sp.]|nr:hypothetical protein [Caulobacter sp.]